MASAGSSKRRWTREQLLESLQFIEDLVSPLPPTLPPSPPASRSSSPAPAIKRKLDSRGDHHHHHPDQTKRQRTSFAAKSSAPRPPVAGPSRTHSHRTDQSEEGEVYEDASHPVATALLPHSSTLPDSAVPVRRPKATRPDQQTFLKLHEKWYLAGRNLKYSGDVRFRSTFPPNHSHYHPLANPPPANSPYHKYGGIIAQLESMDALISFTYAMWVKDMALNGCNHESWKTMDAFLEWCKNKWGPDKHHSSNEAEKAFYGLILMIDAFIKARTSYHNAKYLVERPLKEVTSSIMEAVSHAVDRAEKGGAHSLDGKCSTPKMLPSPASIGPSPSANSTPTSRGSGTPDLSHTAAPSSSAANAPVPSGPVPLPIPARMMPQRFQDMHRKGLPIQKPILDAMAAATGSISASTAQKVSDHAYNVLAARQAVNQSQQHLTLPIMARSFPRTFARMVHSTLDVNEEWAPDFEDEEGELFWPGQALNGEGLGWVCLMGKAMVQEFGRPYGYKGLRGVIPKHNSSSQGSSRVSSAMQGKSSIPSEGSSLSVR